MSGQRKPVESFMSLYSGKSTWGLPNGGLRPLSAIYAQSSTIVHFCGLFGPLKGSEGNFRHKMTTIVGNRGQLWTSTLSPHLLSPHLDVEPAEWLRIGLLNQDFGSIVSVFS